MDTPQRDAASPAADAIRHTGLIRQDASASPARPRCPPIPDASPAHPRPSGSRPQTHRAAPATLRRNSPPASSASPGNPPRCRPAQASSRAAAESFGEWRQRGTPLLGTVRLAAALAVLRTVQAGDAEDELSKKLLQADRRLSDGDRLARLQVRVIPARRQGDVFAAKQAFADDRGPGILRQLD